MFEIRTEFHRVARVWVGDAPAVLGGSAKQVLTNLQGSISDVGSRTVTVEVVIPRGASIQWGMLGVRFDPNRSGLLEVSVQGPGATYGRLPESLLGSFDDPYIGLPDEYAAAAARGIATRFSDAVDAPSGALTFVRAAVSEISSSEEHFEFLGRLVAELLMIDGTSEQVLRALVGGILVGE